MNTATGLTIDWYRGVSTNDLINLVNEAKEKLEYSPDSAERGLWKMRLQRMEEELFRRQALQEQVEV